MGLLVESCEEARGHECSLGAAGAGVSWALWITKSNCEMLDGPLVLLGLEIINRHFLQSVHSGFDHALREEQHFLRVVN